MNIDMTPLCANFKIPFQVNAPGCNYSIGILLSKKFQIHNAGVGHRFDVGVLKVLKTVPLTAAPHDESPVRFHNASTHAAGNSSRGMQLSNAKTSVQHLSVSSCRVYPGHCNY